MTDADYLRQALLYASRSHNARTQVGAVLVCDTRVIYAANRRVVGCAGVEDVDAIEHAERSAIFKAAAAGVRTKGAILYSPWFACTDCARGIVLAGIRQVVGLVRLREATPERWRHTIDVADRMLLAAGVGVRWINDDVGASVLFNGGILRC